VYLRCGSDPAGNPLADVYRVRASLITAVEPTADGQARVETRLEGTAANPTQAQAPVQCTSSGRLEEAIALEIEKHVRLMQGR
jgi:hypothetical protein